MGQVYIEVDYDFMVRKILILIKMHLALLKSEKQFLQLKFILKIFFSFWLINIKRKKEQENEILLGL